jgi:hypothetical protein
MALAIPGSIEVENLEVSNAAICKVYLQKMRSEKWRVRP